MKKECSKNRYENYQPEIAGCKQSSERCNGSKFRLPTEVEWEYAALGMAKNREYNQYMGKKPEIEKLKRY
jgi:formylglycine-generating enzyme required for sulfatase activity